ncbi:CsxC family protein [Neobacillus sp. D3-1R]|uniref:CsxC family protein n=1 Tax=Neobacillus sp. D3-1R TaxID=3445778 RepID=UPI003FA0E790
MKKNTGCNSHGHNGNQSCPPLSACQTGKIIAVDSEFTAVGLPNTGLPAGTLQDVVLQNFELEVDVEDDFHLPTPAREIKWIKKNISLKQCRAVPSDQSPIGMVVKLFLTGILHKNIQYVEQCSGFVRDFSVDIPFTTIKRVPLITPFRNPAGTTGIAFSQKASFNEYRELGDDQHSANRCVTGSRTFEYFTDPIECKILNTIITEIDLLKDFDSFGRFSRVTEKVEIRLFLRLTQNQFVRTPGVPTPAALENEE